MIVILRQLSPTTDFNEVKDKMQEDKLNIALEKQKLSQIGTICDEVGPLNKITVHNHSHYIFSTLISERERIFQYTPPSDNTPLQAKKARKA